MFHHLVARAWPGRAPLGNPDLAWWMMRRLRCTWPDALAACVMPDHVHVLLNRDSPSRLRRQLARVVAAFSRHVRGRRIWQPVPPPERVPNLLHLQRTIRYVHLNPSRARLVQDPIGWPWSTHRELVGAVFDPWVEPRRLAEVLQRRKQDLSDWLHRYVAGDPSVPEGGAAPLVPAPPRQLPYIPLGLILDAAYAATPYSSTAVRRHAFVLLAGHQGWRDSSLLTRAAGVGARRIHTLSRAANPELLKKAALCLGDSRLRSSPNLTQPPQASAGRRLTECRHLAPTRLRTFATQGPS